MYLDLNILSRMLALHKVRNFISKWLSVVIYSVSLKLGQFSAPKTPILIAIFVNLLALILKWNLKTTILKY